jgi:hypothetical protein
VKIFIGFLFFIVGLYAFNIHAYPFDKEKLANYNTNTDLKSHIGPITNQIWIASKKLSKSQLESLVKKDSDFTIIGYHKIYGLLIEFDDTDTKQKQIIEKFKTYPGIDNVYNRVFEGHNAPQLMK